MSKKIWCERNFKWVDFSCVNGCFCEHSSETRAGEKARSCSWLARREAEKKGHAGERTEAKRGSDVGPHRCTKGHPIMCDDTCEGKYCRWPSDTAYDWCADQRSFEEAERRANAPDERSGETKKGNAE